MEETGAIGGRIENFLIFPSKSPCVFQKDMVLYFSITHGS